MIGLLLLITLFLDQNLTHAFVVKDLAEVQECEDAWASLPADQLQFDFAKDTLLTERGNEGYPLYEKRLELLGVDRKTCRKSWTILIYMMPTIDLLPFSYLDILEMEANVGNRNRLSGSSLRSDVIVQLEQPTEGDLRRFHIFQNPDPTWPLPDHSRVSIEQIASPMISFEYMGKSRSQTERFSEFLSWGIRNYPSEHYLVVIWGHGTGRTIGGDGRDLDISSVRAVLTDLKKQTVLPIDILATDACFMQSIETASALDQCTRFIYGSEDVESFAGLPYEDLLAEINLGNRGETDEPRHLVWVLPRLYRNAFAPWTSQHELDPRAPFYLTGSSVDTQSLKTILVPALNNLGNALKGYTEKSLTHWANVRQIIENGITYQKESQDLGAFLTAIRDLTLNDPSPDAVALQRAALTAYDALNSTIVNSALGTRYPKFNPALRMGPRGLSIWLPQSDEKFTETFERHRSSSLFLEARAWYVWLESMYSASPQSQRNLA